MPPIISSFKGQKKKKKKPITSRSFGIARVMLGGVIDLISCWPRQDGMIQGAVWNIIPHCLFWTLWREQNARTFEGCEKNCHELASIFLNTLLKWVNATGLLPSFL